MIRILSIGDKLTEIIRGAFGVSLLEFLINLVATIILIIIVRFLFWDKVTAFLDKKRKKIEDDYALRDDIKKEAEEKLIEADLTLAKSKEKAQELLNQESRLHNDANILALGKMNQSFEEALEIAKTFLSTEFSNEERHIRRIKEIITIEGENN